MITDDEIRGRLAEAAETISEAPPATTEVISAKRRQLRLGRIALAIALVAVAVALSFAAFFTTAAVRPFNVPLVNDPTMEVPDVVGGSADDAVERLEDEKLRAAIEGECDEDDRRCRVSAQDPEAPTRVERGTTVTLRVTLRRSDREQVERGDGKPGKGDGDGAPGDGKAKTTTSPEDPVVVPQLRGKTRAEAEKALKRRRLKSQSTTCRPPRGGACFVDRTDPPGGTEVPRGSTVNLTLVPRGGHEPKVTVPGVEGALLGTAVDKIDDRLTATSVRCDGPAEECYAGRAGVEEADCGLAWAFCTVVLQDPLEGSRVPPQAPVTLTWDLTQVSVPDVVGKTLEEARELLVAAHLTVKDPDSPVGSVEEQDPSANTLVKPGAEVTLTFPPEE